MSLLRSGAPEGAQEKEELPEPDFLRLPQPGQCFSARAARLRQLAQNSAQPQFLRFCAHLAQAQQQTLEEFPAVPLPDADVLAQLDGKLPPLPAHLYARAPAWLEALRHLAQRMQAHAPQGSRAALAALARARAERLETYADWVLHGARGERAAGELDEICAAVLAGALQVYWTRMVTDLARRIPGALGRIRDATCCPCCGALPVTSVLRGAGQRYLHCALCGSQWHMERAKCSHCESTYGITYQAPQPADGRGQAPSVQVEVCSACRHYLKIVHAERDDTADALADDLATPTLDARLNEAGIRRRGVNLMRLCEGMPAVSRAA